ncbi:MAG: hypothetical protein QM500_05720 [Methylococcales bacterium]
MSIDNVTRLIKISFNQIVLFTSIFEDSQTPPNKSHLRYSINTHPLKNTYPVHCETRLAWQ